MLEEGEDRAGSGSGRHGPGERRAVGQALAWWNATRRERPLPARRDLRLGRLPAPSRAAVFLVDLAEGVDRATFLRAGRTLVRFCADDPTGLPVAASLPEALWERLRHTFDAAVQERRPIALSGTCAGRDGIDALYRSVVMPLGDDGATVDALAGTFTYRRLPL